MRRDAGRDSSARPGSGRITDILSSRIRLRPREPERSHRFYRDSLGLAIYREFGHPGDRGLAFFLGQGFLEVAGRSKEAVARGLAIWLQVRDVQAEYERLRVAGVRVRREPKQESWGLVEMWIEDPDGVRIVLVEVPENHPLRRDQR